MSELSPSERLILKTLLAECEQPTYSRDGWGPYGRAARRLGVLASRIGEVEERHVGFAAGQDHNDAIRAVL